MTFWKAAFIAFALVVPGCDQKPEAPQEIAPPVVDATPAKPALWKIADADTVVYFFGAVHVLPPALPWRSAAVDGAFADSRAVYFETDMDPDPQEFRAIVERLGHYDPSDRLSDRVDPADLPKLTAAAEALDVPMVYLDTLRPWYAAIVMSDAVIRKAGYDSGSGVENVLGPLARTQGKEIRKFETTEEQMLAFSTLPEADQIRFLIDGLGDIAQAGPTLANMVNTWKSGDLEKLHRILIEDDLARVKAIYDALLVNRNARWAPVIDTLMKSETGTFFVAVGAAHLIGADSVFEKLKPLGYQASRVQ